MEEERSNCTFGSNGRSLSTCLFTPRTIFNDIVQEEEPDTRGEVTGNRGNSWGGSESLVVVLGDGCK